MDSTHSSLPTLLEAERLAVVLDPYGTLVPRSPFTTQPEILYEARALVAQLAELPGLTVALFSHRSRVRMAEWLPLPPGACLFAEHGAWQSQRAAQEDAPRAAALDDLVTRLSPVRAHFGEAHIECAKKSLTFDFADVHASRRAACSIALAAALAPWQEAEVGWECVWEPAALHVRTRGTDAGAVVRWMRDPSVGATHTLLLGSDGDEELFEALVPGQDVGVWVGEATEGPVAATHHMANIAGVRELLREIIGYRTTKSPMPRLASLPPAAPNSEQAAQYDLLVLSNRLPDLRETTQATRAKSVGGLVSALQPVLAMKHGVWLGWSGKSRLAGEDQPGKLVRQRVAGMTLASLDFPESWQRMYYTGFSNRALWPLLHSIPSRVAFSHDEWRAYERANRAFADHAVALLRPGGTVWVHDYHLMLVAEYLRHAGHVGRLGFFLHVPFPGPDIFAMLPWAETLLGALLHHDRVGFHTPIHVDNFLHCVRQLLGTEARIDGQTVHFRGRTTHVGAFPLGIMPQDFQLDPDVPASDEILGLERSLDSKRLVLGVDRLDYTKGIPQRIEAFGRLLELWPEWRKKVSFVQISVPSREDVPEYAQQRAVIEQAVGRINGEHGEADWVPIRYLYRSYERTDLAHLYAHAAVGLVAPLRDGMNLVAKEFVAAQRRHDPGVLVLSRFAGAAEELRDAVLVNPWDIEGTARGINVALQMDATERTQRHERLLQAVSSTSALTWADDFLTALARE